MHQRLPAVGTACADQPTAAHSFSDPLTALCAAPCSATGTSCAADGDAAPACVSEYPGLCIGGCLANGSPCAAGTDCCGGNATCYSSTCSAATACLDAQPCVSDGQCCSGICDAYSACALPPCWSTAALLSIARLPLGYCDAYTGICATPCVPDGQGLLRGSSRSRCSACATSTPAAASAAVCRIARPAPKARTAVAEHAIHTPPPAARCVSRMAATCVDDTQCCPASAMSTAVSALAVAWGSVRAVTDRVIVPAQLCDPYSSLCATPCVSDGAYLRQRPGVLLRTLRRVHARRQRCAAGGGTPCLESNDCARATAIPTPVSAACPSTATVMAIASPATVARASVCDSVIGFCAACASDGSTCAVGASDCCKNCNPSTNICQAACVPPSGLLRLRRRLLRRYCDAYTGALVASYVDFFGACADTSECCAGWMLRQRELKC